MTRRRPVRRAAARAALLLAAIAAAPSAHGRPPRDVEGPEAACSLLLGRPSDRSVVLSVLSSAAIEAVVEYGTAPGALAGRTGAVTVPAGVPVEIGIAGLRPDTRYHYRLRARAPGRRDEAPGLPGTFHTQRAAGRPFTFALQGDSHPERAGKMFDAALYARTLRAVAEDPPDFYLTLGDDFSIERLIERRTLSQAAVDQVYARHRGFLGLVGRSSPLFLVNGNHEQAARYLLDGTDRNAAVLAARARVRFYPLPAPDGFYTGDAEQVEPVGLLRDYYAWTWGDALFVVIDPYWHSPVAVDNVAGERPPEPGGARDGGKDGKPDGRRGGRDRRDLWQVTLGEAQYRWLAGTLTGSRARWKFVFAHHVNGTGRGGVECAGLYEWGGRDKRGVDRFAEKRPGWDLPIHPLLVKAGVTIIFQGHDHLYARQELDGVVYQSTPNPADDTYQAFNRDAYRSGDVLPNSGHLRVSVSPGHVRVDYVRSFLAGDEGPGRVHGAVAHTYTIPAKPGGRSR